MIVIELDIRSVGFKSQVGRKKGDRTSGSEIHVNFLI